MNRDRPKMSILSWPPEELKGRTVNLHRVFRKEAFDFALGPLTFFSDDGEILQAV